MRKDALPESWAHAPIAECSDLNPKLDKSQINDAQLVHFVPMPSVEALTNKIDISAVRPFGEVKKGYTPFASGDVIFAKITPCMENGKTAVVPDLPHGIAFGSTEFHVIRPRGALDPRWFYYFLSSRSYRSTAEHNMTGAVGQRRVPIEFIAGSLIPLPPLAEQKRIVAKIEELFSELESGEENLRTARRQLSTYRQSLLKQAFQGHLTAKWRTVKVCDIGRIETGTTPPTANPNNYGGDLPFFKPTDLEQGRYVKTAREHLSKAGQKHARVLPAGSVLVTCIGATIGKTGLAQLACATNQQINSISPGGDILPEFAYYQAISPQFQEQIKTNASSTTLPILNKSKFCALPFVVCPLPEQHEIVRLLDEQFEAIGRNEREIDAALKRSEALRQSILHRAFTGRLVPQDPADEPATELLARLRAAKAAAPARQSRKARSDRSD